MYKFHFLRSIKDLVGHFILIGIPVVLITVFNFLYNQNVDPAVSKHVTAYLTVGMMLPFHVWGAALSFETIGADFLTPMYDRLMASPEKPQKIVISILFTSMLVSFIQSIVILGYGIIVLGAYFIDLWAVVLLLILSIVFHQLLGTIVLFASKSVKVAASINTFYGIAAPVIAGLYFPLPDHPITNFMKQYLTPVSLSFTSIWGVQEGDTFKIVVGAIPLFILSIILFLLIKPLSKRVIR